MSHYHSFDPVDRAREAMHDAGFVIRLPDDAREQLRSLDEGQHLSQGDPSIRDLRSLLWSSIDNEESRDLDQVEVCEKLPDGTIRVLIGIADVDAFVAKGSPLDRHAAHNTTSVYTGIATFPMLPEQISTHLTSLNEGEERLAVVLEMDVTTTGELASTDIYRALLRNHAKLVYEQVGAWLEGEAHPPSELRELPGLEEQVRLQDEAATRLHGQRQRMGALDFETIEARPVVADGRVVNLTIPQKNRARLLIENFMIAANTATATHLRAKGLASIQRVVREPERWPRIVAIAAQHGERLPDQPDPHALNIFLQRRKKADPEHFPDLSLSVVKLLGPGEYTVVQSATEQQGHFGLAAQNYAHSTAPNRRYADLITQRVIKAAIAGNAPPYTLHELEEVVAQCTERENAARKVERLMRKVAAALMLQDRIGDEFSAIVTGASVKGTYARVIEPPVEGRIVRGERGLDVGDKVRLRLIHTAPERGFIDFERA